MGQAVNTNTRL